jgi:hypothetical protein
MTDERIIAYLLGELPEKESEQFEDECFAQERWPAQISLNEEDLIDAYLRDELTPDRRQRFEQNYLTTEAREERVIMAAAFLRRLDECHAASQTAVHTEPAKTTWAERLRAFWNSQSLALRAAAAFVVIAILAGTLWLSLLRAPSPNTFATINLRHSYSNRAGGVQAGRVKLPLEADALRIRLELPERLPPAGRYRVELENEDGETQPLEIAGQDAQSLSVVIPASRLERGIYALNIFTANSDGTAEQPINGNYFLTVE